MMETTTQRTYKPRIIWSDDDQQKLAHTTALVLIGSYGVHDDQFDDREMMAAFRTAMLHVLKESKLRNIAGPSHVRWLRKKVTEEIYRHNEHPTPLPVPPKAADVKTALDLILDTLTHIQAKQAEQDDRLAAMKANIVSITHAVEKLGRVIVRRRRERAAHKAILRPPEAPTIHIAVAALLGHQQESVRKRLAGFPYPIELTFVDTSVKSPPNLAKFDWLIISGYAGRGWRKKALQLHPGKTIVTHRSINDIVDAIHKVARQAL
jgi:hypothetical protein